MPNPPIAITVGDAAGIGPEIVLRAIQAEYCRRDQDGKDNVRGDHAVAVKDQFQVYGSRSLLRRVAATLSIELPNEWYRYGVTNIEFDSPSDAELIVPGQFSLKTGRASYKAVDRAIDDANSGNVSAVVTGPIQKEAWRLAGIDFPGHTELLADRCGCEAFSMMLVSDVVACVLATIHIGIRDVPDAITSKVVQRAIRHAIPVALRRHAAKAKNIKLDRPPTITVCGLNPHAGEAGMFGGGEEEQTIAPAIEACKQWWRNEEQAAPFKEISIQGPLPADTAFTKSMLNQTDVYVAMYHDQGLIPVKTLSFESAVNVTLGLPIIRTSVDHGTAMDIAWKGIADHRNLIAAIREAQSILADPQSIGSF